jgi:class 3 adenylate cyclase
MGCVSASGAGIVTEADGACQACRSAGWSPTRRRRRSLGRVMLSPAEHPEPSAQTRVQRSSIDVIASALEPVLPDFGRLSSPDGAVTLMLCDVQDAEEIAQRLGPDQWTELLRDHHALVRQVVDHHDGQLATVQDDGFMAYFNSAHGALHCAIELQRTFSAGSESGMALRMGLHSGFVIANPDQLLGRNVVLAARIADKAAGGEILVSSTLKEYTEGDPRFQFELRGEFHFKGMLGEHVIYAVRSQPYAVRSQPDAAG